MSLREIGLLFSFRNPSDAQTPWADFYQSELDLTVYAEELGYDQVWLTEHHFIDDGYSPSLFVIGGAIAARTRKIRIGTYIVLMPLHDPVFVAEDSAAIDIISGGRFDLGLGLGYRPGEFIGLGIPMSERGARLEESAPLIRELFAGGEVNHEGEFYTAKNIT
ncbi:MAG TPA: LLM class flavin-dependent oxidoreductase, partial [Sneathiellales bacterium]|nr:LLM class flavin-dependent oxidoreductase [Sneathiellales bacterium]